MNTGLALTSAPFVARLDADDLSAPDRHARQVRHLLAHPDCIACSGAHQEMDAAGRDVPGRIHRATISAPPDPFWIPAREPPLTQPFFMARRAALLHLGGYRPLPVSEDSDLYWRLTAIGRLDVLPDVLGRYRMHGGSISAASIRHGRRMALWSQLAAVSAQRRRTARPDLMVQEYALQDAPGAGPSDRPLHDQVAAACAALALDGDEAAWLATATAAKLMELAGYRPFDLMADDVAYLAEQLADAPDDLHPMLAATGARLLRAGRWRDALRIGQGHWPGMMARAATNRLYWTKRPA